MEESITSNPWPSSAQKKSYKVSYEIFEEKAAILVLL